MQTNIQLSSPPAPPGAVDELSPDHFELFLGAVEDGVTVHNASGALVYANHSAAQLFGFAAPSALLAASSAELAARFELFDEQGAPVSLAELPAHRALAGAPGSSALLRVRLRDSGEERWIRARGSVVHAKDGAYAVNTLREAPERAERTRRAAAETERLRLQELLQQAPAAVALWRGPEHRFELANPRYCELVGRSAAELIGKPIAQVFPDFAKSELWPVFNRVFREGEPFLAPEFEARLERGDGEETAWFAFNLHPIRCEDGRVDGVMALAVEITDTVLARRRLRESEYRFAQILDSLDEMVFTKSRELVVTYANRAACQHYGMSPAALLGASDGPHNQREVTEQYQRDERIVFESGQIVERREEPNVRHDGELRLFHTIKSPLYDTQGRVAELVGVARDITDSKKSEQQRVEYQKRLEFALEAGKMGTWDWRIPENRVIWSAAVERMHGIPVGSFPGTFEAYQRDIHPDDRDRVLESVQRVLSEGADHELTYRIVRPDGETRWLQASGRLVCDALGNPERLTGVCRDVTEQKRNEEAQARLLAAEAASAEADRARGELIEILESITDPFSVLDEQLRVTYLNRAAVELTGLEREALLGKRPWEVLPAAQEWPFTAAYEEALRDKRHVVADAYFAPWQRWFEVSVFPLRRGISVYTRDITEKRKTEQLRERLASYAAARADVSATLSAERDLRPMLQGCCQALVRHLGVAFARIWTLDAAESTLELQASAGLYTHIDGGHRAVPVGKFKIGRIAAERSPHLTNDVQNDPRVSDREWAKREGMIAFAGYPLLVDGRVLGVLAMFAQRQLEVDTLNALAGIADTVAQGIARRRAEEELEHRMEELSRSNAELEQFAYVASHDLQEPLRVIASYNQLLARRYKGKLDEDADEFIGYTVEGVTRMQRLINDLLAYSRVGTQGRPFSEVDLGAVLDVAKENLEQAISDENATIVHGALPRVYGDEGQLLQLVQNLLSNAIKFHGEQPPQIDVQARQEGAQWVISMKDNGIGMESQYLDRIFVIFQRLHPREKYPGTGIGLAICKKIIERHGGRIWVESNPGEGSTVSFSMPVSGAKSGRSK